MAEQEPGDPTGLYGLDPNDFVAARNELAKALRKAGDRELAADVAKLRRPTPAAWAVNQLVRRHRAEVEELVALGEALREAQGEALAGGEPGDLRQAGRARRDAVARLADRVDVLLVERGGGAGVHTSEVTATLEAASLDADAATAVLGGQLSAELQPPSGFGVLDAPPAAPRPERKKPAEPEGDAGPSPAKVRKAQETAAEARRDWEERSAQSRTAIDRVREMRKAAEQAEAEIARLEDLLAEAQRKLRTAVQEAELAEDKASRFEEAAARATAARRDADRRLAELGG